MNRPEDIELVEEGAHQFVLRGGARSVRLDNALLPATRLQRACNAPATLSILAMPGVFTLADLSSASSTADAVRAIVRLLSSSFLRVVD